MPEQEFELYLSALSQFLRLRPDQRAEIADELRDHLEERFHELVAAGCSRQEAIRQALEELGEASLLASDFTSIHHFKTRRLVMRWTVRSIVAMTAIVLLTFALWPVQNQVAPQPAVAQLPGLPKSAGEPIPGQPPAETPANPVKRGSQAEAELKLEKEIPKLQLDGIPFTDVMTMIATQTETDILIDTVRLNDEGIDTQTPITLNIERTPITARTALELVLEPINLGLTFRDGLILITTPSQTSEVQVYNCRDLLPGPWPTPGQSAGESGMGIAPGFGLPSGVSGMSGMPGMPGMMPASGSSPIPGASSPEGKALIEAIVATVAAESWKESGGQGAVSEFKGLLVVKQTQSVHREIRQLLEKLRSAASEHQPGRSSSAGESPTGLAPR